MAQSPRDGRVKKLVRTTLSSQLCEQIRTSILDATFPLGAQLNEMQLAESFGVSRGPVREALQRLIQEGLLRSEPHRGVFVPELEIDDLLDIYFVRQSLELIAIERVMALPDRKALVRTLLASVDTMEAARQREDWAQMADADMAFHRTIVDGAGSERLSRGFVTLQAETRLCLRMLMGGYRDNDALVAEHRLLAALIGGTDAAAARTELERHFGDPIATLQKANRLREGKSEIAA